MEKLSLIEAYEIMFTEFPDVVDVKDVCDMLGLCTKKVYELIHSGDILIIPCCKCFKIAKLSVIEYLLNNQSAA